VHVPLFWAVSGRFTGFKGRFQPPRPAAMPADSSSYDGTRGAGFFLMRGAAASRASETPKSGPFPSSPWFLDCDWAQKGCKVLDLIGGRTLVLTEIVTLHYSSFSYSVSYRG